jgi:molecular chaperone GrpE
MEDLQEDLTVTEEVVAPAIEESTVDPLAELQKQLAEAKDQYLRARAETENVRRRGIEDIAKAHKFAIERFAEELIPVADSLYAASETDESEGLKMTLQQLLSAFEKHKLVQINPSVTSAFDPHKHQAISTIESEQEENTIVSVLQKGYMIADRVLRPAMVSVSKGRTEE